MAEPIKKSVHISKEDFLGLDAASIQRGMKHHMNYTVAKHSVRATDWDLRTQFVTVWLNVGCLPSVVTITKMRNGFITYH